jgi:hypothetical protein
MPVEEDVLEYLTYVVELFGLYVPIAINGCEVHTTLIVFEEFNHESTVDGLFVVDVSICE